ncbi:alpha/beta fold hydrolase [Kitasatospora sp. NPDC101157]|uniref:alpha/beta fold hydrolase n=1 Tax=Kitasatospora sp. NPDC101157 TaxID=3364098 RepID=UPI0038250B99
MFTGFDLTHITVNGVTLRVRHGGDGPAVLLVHGHPRTHTTWHRVAPLLAQEYTVVCPDLRGYGQSTKPPTDETHTPYSKREMANDLVALMKALGHDRYHLVGHDRGGYAAMRLALDHPAAVSHYTALDVVPIGEALSRCDANFATRWWHWFFRAQPFPLPETAISGALDQWYPDPPEHMGTESWLDFQESLKDPRTIRAMCEDYRAGLGIDRQHDEADRAADRRITCPVHVLWATESDLPLLYEDIEEAWRPWVQGELQVEPLKSGHHIAEDAPEELAHTLLQAWSAVPQR